MQKRKNKLKPQLIGCGFYIYLVKHLEQVWIAFPFDRISPLIDILLSANAETVNYHITKMYETLGPRNQRNYYRLMPQLRNASSEMDDTSKKNIYELIQAGLYYVDSNREMLNEIAKKLIKNK